MSSSSFESFDDCLMGVVTTKIPGPSYTPNVLLVPGFHSYEEIQVKV